MQTLFPAQWSDATKKNARPTCHSAGEEEQHLKKFNAITFHLWRLAELVRSSLEDFCQRSLSFLERMAGASERSQIYNLCSPDSLSLFSERKSGQFL